jgi:hypothetical protein
MITLKKFLTEYLTEDQKKSFADVSMTDKARADTDHFFGKGNDIIHGEISTHFTGRGLRKNSFKTSTARGTKIIDKTNNTEDLHHSGLNKRQYLKNEIRHGTVVYRVHDHAGHEIYHATLQPYHNYQGHVAYNVDSEYGVNHPIFTKKAFEVAKKLSGEYKPGVFKKHPDVYSENEKEYILHPNANIEHLHKSLNSRNIDERLAAAAHPNLSSVHLHKALEDEDSHVRYVATLHPNLSSDHLHKALNDKDWTVRANAASHPNAAAEHLHKALNDKDERVREAVAKNINVNAEHLHKALNDEDVFVRKAAASNPNANPEHLNKALNDKDKRIREAAASHPNANAENLYKALNDEDIFIRKIAAKHPNANTENLHKALNDKNKRVRESVKRNPNYKMYFQ